MKRWLLAALFALVLPAALVSTASAAPSGGRHAVLRVEDTETFNCKDTAFCDAIFESDASSHESAVLYSDGTGHNHPTAHCGATIPGICAAGSTVVVSEDFAWFAAPAACDENGCAPITRPCTP